MRNNVNINYNYKDKIKIIKSNQKKKYLIYNKKIIIKNKLNMVLLF